MSSASDSPKVGARARAEEARERERSRGAAAKSTEKAGGKGARKGKGPAACWKCGETGHFARDCPKGKGRGKGSKGK